MLPFPDPRRPDRANPSTNFWWSLFWQHRHDLHALGSYWTVNKEYYVEVLKEFRKRFRRKRLALFKSGQWHFHQDNAPVHNSILVTDYLTKMGIKTVAHPPYSPDLATCDLWLFPKLRGCRYEETKEAVTKVKRELLWGLSEVVGMVEQVHCSWRRLLQRGQEFHGCTINKSAHMKKSGNLFNDPCILQFLFYTHLLDWSMHLCCHFNICTFYTTGSI